MLGTSRARLLLPDVALVLIVAAVFGGALGFPFVNWDDGPQITLNTSVHHPLAQGWIAFLFAPPEQMGYPQPLTVATQHLDGVIGGFAPRTFHATNLLLHAIGTLLVRRLVLASLREGAAMSAFVAAALFACHPIVAESVCWCTGRKDLLLLVCLAGGLLLCRQARAARGAGATLLALGVVVAFLGALGAKPSGAVFPFLVALDMWVRRERPTRVVVGLLAGGAAISAAWIIRCFDTQVIAGAVVHAPSVAERLLLASQHTALQLRNVGFPVLLAPSYDHESLPRPLASPWGIAGVVAPALLVVGLAGALRRGALGVALGLGWFAIVFAPSSGLVPLNRGPADTYAYAALPGLAVCAASALERARPVLRASLGMASVAVLALVCHEQTLTWRSSAALWERHMEVYPDEPRAWWQYGEGLLDDGRADEATAVLEEALKRFPSRPEGLVALLGYACSRAGRLDCGVRAYGDIVRHYACDPEQALYFLELDARAPDPQFAPEVERARSIVARALGDVHDTPPAARHDAARFFAARFVRGEPVPMAALARLSADPALGADAAMVLDVSQHDRPRVE